MLGDSEIVAYTIYSRSSDLLMIALNIIAPSIMSPAASDPGQSGTVRLCQLFQQDPDSKLCTPDMRFGRAVPSRSSCRRNVSSARRIDPK